MRFNVSTNLSNGAGLQRDYELVKHLLEGMGHAVHGLMFNDYAQPVPPADICIAIEVITPQQLVPGTANWFIPNSEWYFPCWNGQLARFSKILCKTKDCYNIWCKKVGAGKCVYIGWESLDFYDPDATRLPAFLHMAGKSETKNTAAVIAAWRNYKLPYHLTAVAWRPDIVRLCQNVPNVTHVERYSDADVARAMNTNIFHVMPSRYEGFGHYIHEAIGCGGIVLTTDAPPMNEFNGIHREFLIPVEKREVRLEAFFNHVSPVYVADAVHRAAGVSQEKLLEYRKVGRAAFLADRDAFREAFAEVVNAR